MKTLASIVGALMLVAIFVTNESLAAAPDKPAQSRMTVQGQVGGAAMTTVGHRNYPRAYRYNSYYGPRRGYYNDYYYGPRYRTYYGYGPRYRGGYYYGPSYYRGPAGAVNVYPGGVDVGGLHIGW